LQSKLGRDPSERPAPREPGITRPNSFSAQLPGRRGAMTTPSMIERLTLEMGGRAACPSSLVKPIRGAVELRHERASGRKLAVREWLLLAAQNERWLRHPVS
jgi:hypothetical protein